MPRKKKTKPEEKGTPITWDPKLEMDETLGGDQLTPTVEKVVVEEEVTAKKPSDTVTVKVLIGTLGWSGGVYEKGEIFTISREDLKRFDPRYYQIIE